MKHTDEHIRDLFKDLANHESDVRPELWNSIQSALPAAAGSATIGTWIAAKIWWIAAGAAAVAVITYSLVSSTPEEKPVADNQTVTAQNRVEPAIIEEVDSTDSAEYQQPTLVTKGNNMLEYAILEEEETNRIVPDLPQDSAFTPSKTQGIPDGGDGDNQDNPPLVPKTDAPESTPFNAEFNAVQVDKNQLKFFFFPQFPEEESYSWSIGGEEISDEMTASYTFPEQGDYEVNLTVTRKDGVQRSSTLPVSAWVAPQLVLPTVFTPNTDAKNEYFDPAARSTNVTVTYIAIFTAQGQMVFESDGTRLWDGNDAFGNPLPAGPYKAVVKATDRRGESLVKTGNLMLTRD